MSLAGYTELGVLGEGAGGRVVAARHDATREHVAIKYLRPELGEDTEFVRAYRSEARVMAELDDQNIARLYEYVEDASGIAIVMELVDGASVEALLADAGPLSPQAALVVLHGSLCALAAAHERGVVHRDYKPANVLVTRDGDSRLVDFGIARRRGANGDTSGSPSYMAPEQWRGEPCGPPADIYAATATFVECVTGRPPFEGAGIEALALQHRNAPVPLDRLPEPVRGIAAAGLAKDAARRPASARDFVTELTAAAVAGYGEDWEESGRGHLAARVAALLALLPVGGAELAAADLARTRLRRLSLLAGTAATALLLGGAAAAVTPSGSQPRHVADTTVLTSSAPTPSSAIPSSRSSAPPPRRHASRHARPTSSARSSSTSTPSVTTTSSRPNRRRSITNPPTSPHSSSSAPPPAPVVHKFEITSLTWNGGTGPDWTATLYLTVSSTAPVHLTLHYSNGQGFDVSTSQTLSGSTVYHPTDVEGFKKECGVITLTATTDAGGSATASLPEVTKC
jgi:serine/threonine-protein kinase